MSISLNTRFRRHRGAPPPAPAAPTASNALPDISVTQSTGVVVFDLSGDFSGVGLAFSLSTNPDPANISIDPSSGVLSISTSAIALMSGSPVVARATNAGGSATSGFSLTVSSASSATAAPVVSASSYSNGAVSVTMNAESGSCTIDWTAHDSVGTQTASGSFVSNGPAGSGSITVTDTTTTEIRFTATNALGNTGTPSLGNNTIIQNVVVYPTPYVATGVAVPSPSGSTNNYTVDMEPGMNVVQYFAGLGSGKVLSAISLDGNPMTPRASNTVIGTNQPLVQYEYFHAGAKKASVTLSVTHTATPFRAFYQMNYHGNASWVASVVDPASASYTQVLTFSGNTNAGDQVSAIGFIRDSVFAAGSYALTGLTKSFDAAVEGTRYAVTGHNMATTGGAPEAFTMDCGLTPGFEHIGVLDIYRQN